MLSRDDIVGELRTAGCVFAEDEADLILAAPVDAVARRDMVTRRAGGVPLEQVLGWAGFCGERIDVTDGVFVPRHRTGCLVRRAVELAPPRPTVVDLCCGSGAIGVVLARRLPGARVYAADIDPVAVRCAARNLARVGGRAYRGDLFAALPAQLAGRVDILAANVPYVPTGAVPLLPPEARLYEPLTALDGGADGLDVLRRVAAGAPGWLAPAGHLLAEVADDQLGTARSVLRDAGLRPSVVRYDDLDATAVVGSR